MKPLFLVLCLLALVVGVFVLCGFLTWFSCRCFRSFSYAKGGYVSPCTVAVDFGDLELRYVAWIRERGTTEAQKDFERFYLGEPYSAPIDEAAPIDPKAWDALTPTGRRRDNHVFVVSTPHNTRPLYEKYRTKKNCNA